MKIKFFNFVILFLTFSGHSNAENYVDLDPRVSPCTRGAIESSVNTWIKDGNLPSHSNPKLYKTLYDALIECGVFSNSTPPAILNKLIEQTFGRSHFDLNSINHTVSVRLANGERVHYAMKKNDDRKFEIQEVSSSNGLKQREEIIYGPELSIEQKRGSTINQLNNCKMSSSEVMSIVDRHVKTWLTTDKIPGWENKHEGYENLFKDLKQIGIFEKNVEYQHFIFGRSETFTNNNYGGPKLSIRVNESVHEFRIDAVEKRTSRPVPCSDSRIKTLEEARDRLKITNDENKEARTKN